HFSTALSRVFGSALNGTVRDRPELAEEVQPLEATLDPVAVRGGEGLIRELFAPLGYAVEVTRHPLDPAFPEWGEGPCHRIALRAETTVTALLRHLYVLVPVLDDDKHYWVGDDEIAKLLAKAGDWLGEHPMRDAITHRYLARQRSLTRRALALFDDGAEATDEAAGDVAEAQIERPVRLDDARRTAV
ncbi:MAG: 3' terminal RNA ribose 2'-O-methyltransferase Hen1, partial [Myxococcales bacterium]|nr:3' terminal RNA ribose 2'-O-methyltransferase Hen1 [Myxococcales bacterium]